MIYVSKMYMSAATKKYELVSHVNWKAKTLEHLKVDQVLKINATFYSSLDLCEQLTDHNGSKNIWLRFCE